jgi:hypothetical protein
MWKASDVEKGRWEQVMESFDLLFSQMNDIGVIQQELKKELTATKEDQKLIAKQVQANGQAVANLTLRHMENEALTDNSENNSVVFDDDDEPTFQNVFAKARKKTRLALPGSQGTLERNQGESPYPIIHCPRYIFLSLMEPTQRYGLITVSTTLPYIPFLMS